MHQRRYRATQHVRKHLSRVKGGGLLTACRAGQLVTLVLSDVLGDPLDLIASGPTVIDPSTPQQALEVLSTYDPDRKLPDSVYRTLQLAKEQDNPKPGTELCRHTAIVLGNNALAVDEAGIVAEQQGYNHVMQSARQSEGAAEDVGRNLAEMAIHMLRNQTEMHQNDCLITGGEPTVVLAPEEIRGLGGRNQQLILSAYQTLLASDLLIGNGTGFVCCPVALTAKMAHRRGGAILDSGPPECSQYHADAGDYLARTMLIISSKRLADC